MNHPATQPEATSADHGRPNDGTGLDKQPPPVCTSSLGRGCPDRRRPAQGRLLGDGAAAAPRAANRLSHRPSARIASCRRLQPSRVETSFTGLACATTQRMPPLVGGGHARQRLDSGARSPPPPARRARRGSSGEQRMRAWAGRQGWCAGEPARRWLSEHWGCANLRRRCRALD